MRTAKRNKPDIFPALFVVAFVIMMAAATSLSGCSAFQSFISELKGELIGNDYNISQYDNFGSLVFTVHGDKVTMDGEVDSLGEPTSYIDITIDGKEWQHVGGTLVFAQNGVDMVTDFQVPQDIQSDGSSLGLIAADKFVNHYKNLFGKKTVVLVSSQTGAPIGLFQGDRCYTEVPGDLPKTTLINIDGKLVYVHRANVDIMPADMFN